MFSVLCALLCFTVLIDQQVLCKPQGLTYRADDNNFRHESSCLTKENQNGTCIGAEYCVEYYDSLYKSGRDPAICFWEGPTPVICCPTDKIRYEVKHRIIRDCENYIAAFKVVLKKYQPPLIQAVFHGRPAQIFGFPHMLRMGWIKSPTDVDFRLGGSLITLKHVLTAAHGVSADPPRVVVAGSNTVYFNSSVEVPQFRAVSRVFIHPGYVKDSQGQPNDIAILLLNRDMEIHLNVRPACIWIVPPPVGQKTIIIGFGQTSFGGPYSSYLLEGQVEILKNDECTKHFGALERSQLCAQDKENLTDTCQGDSGGPLMTTFYNDSRSYFNIAGVTSYGGACGAGFPAVYTSVYSFIDWIEGVVYG